MALGALNKQPGYAATLYQVNLQNFIYVPFVFTAEPNPLWIYHQGRAMFAAIQALASIDANIG